MKILANTRNQKYANPKTVSSIPFFSHPSLATHFLSIQLETINVTALRLCHRDLDYSNDVSSIFIVVHDCRE